MIHQCFESVHQFVGVSGDSDVFLDGSHHVGLAGSCLFQENYVALGLLQLLLTAAVMVINQKFFISGFQSLFHRAPNMDTLVALGAAAAFVYSTYAPLCHDRRPSGRGDTVAAMGYLHDFTSSLLR